MSGRADRSDPIPPPALLPETGTVGDSFPHPQERALMAHFPPFVEGCHRYANHYAKAVAQVERGRSGDRRPAGLLDLWEFAGPTGTPAPDPAVTKTPAAVVTALYERYLLRDARRHGCGAPWRHRAGVRVAVPARSQAAYAAGTPLALQ
ncbi:MAG: hypothetical protein QOG45_1689 [Chloroflexota bacterium]|jgi:hypothetical protein|nr:hypothetical protein [Chloroflexota bacterium]